MSTLSKNTRGESVRETIARRAGPAAHAHAIAQSTLFTWQQIAAQLEPVIGARGVDALFSRSLHLVAKAHPWLATGGVRGNDAASLASIKTCLESRDALVASDGASALLDTFIDLLARLIGESLTTRLLETVWLQPLTDNPKESAPCATQ